MSWCIKNWRAIIAPFVISNVPCNFKDTLNQSFGYQCPLTRRYCYYRFKIWTYTVWNQMTSQIVLNQGIFLFNSCFHYTCTFQFTVERSNHFTSGVFPVLYEKMRYPIRGRCLKRHVTYDTILWWMSSFGAFLTPVAKFILTQFFKSNILNILRV